MLLALSLHDLDLRLNGWANGLQWPVEPMIRLGLAAVLGGLVGLEREVRGRHAGFRTNMLVALGCCLAMVVSVSFAFHPWPKQPGDHVDLQIDPARIAYGVMTGIGFLGAGVIVKYGTTVHGLTTAAAMWCVAAIGLACGMGLYLIALTAAVGVMTALWLLDHVERFLPKIRYRTITLRRPWHPGVVADTVRMIEEQEHLDVRDASFERRGDDLTTVEIRLGIAFSSKKRYFKFEQDLDRRDDCQLIAAGQG